MISVEGKSARTFYLEKQYVSDFKSLLRTVTSGRVLIVSTRFRTDLFYGSNRAKNKSILKLWALYANASLESIKKADYSFTKGDQKALTKYFEIINQLANNWQYYRLYQRAFSNTFSNDPQNHVARTIVQCDHFLIQHPSINRPPLIKGYEKLDMAHTKDSFALAMYILNDETHSN